MTKFNVIQKKRRALIAQNKRKIHGDPLTKKLKQKPQPLSVSGKRKRKLLKKSRREHNEALQRGLITMEGVEMEAAAAAQGAAKDSGKAPTRFHMKSPKLKLRQLKHRGKNQKRISGGAAEVPGDAMVE